MASIETLNSMMNTNGEDILKDLRLKSNSSDVYTNMTNMCKKREFIDDAFEFVPAYFLLKKPALLDMNDTQAGQFDTLVDF